MVTCNKIISSFPSCSVWEEYYRKFRGALVGKLNSAYCLADREDAVEEAFNKLMNRKDPEAYGDKMPDTESKWFWALYWQARSFLSHQNERFQRHAKYVEEMAKELEGDFAPGFQGLAMDNDVRAYALVKALDAFRKDHDVSRRNFEVYIASALKKLSSKAIAEKYGISENNVYVIKFRVGKLLRKYGKLYFNDALKKAS